jgi:hypothetical protein
MITHYCDDDDKEKLDVKIDLSGFGAKEGSEIELYLLDGDHDLELVSSSTYFSDRFITTLNMPNFTSYLIKIKN